MVSVARRLLLLEDMLQRVCMACMICLALQPALQQVCKTARLCRGSLVSADFYALLSWRCCVLRRRFSQVQVPCKSDVASVFCCLHLLLWVALDKGGDVPNVEGAV